MFKFKVSYKIGDSAVSTIEKISTTAQLAGDLVETELKRRFKTAKTSVYIVGVEFLQTMKFKKTC
ncbi:hypothetical protein [Bacillus thuringiensis]|uniref:Uncharacterized protein n=1 Tax=Bacillus thuringiensis TaxID=1428 RepID=A0A9X6WG94_BACTU|nr:hypothetical protein [Bacillus thuringiensis]PFJ27139.1 hypothetical protein COJ15_34480 [Bacillus thuringiensis]